MYQKISTLNLAPTVYDDFQERASYKKYCLPSIAIIVQSVGAALQLPIFDVLEVAAFIVDSFAEGIY